MLGQLRIAFADHMGMKDEGEVALTWVVDFPFYEWDEKNKKLDFGHNPFSMPKGGMEALEKAGLEKGCTARAARYKLLETRVYPVDNDFPALTLDSFVGGALPPSVIKVKYTLDLSGVASRTTI